MTVPNETRWNGKHEVCARWRRGGLDVAYGSGLVTTRVTVIRSSSCSSAWRAGTGLCPPRSRFS